MGKNCDSCIYSVILITMINVSLIILTTVTLIFIYGLIDNDLLKISYALMIIMIPVSIHILTASVILLCMTCMVNIKRILCCHN